MNAHRHTRMPRRKVRMPAGLSGKPGVKAYVRVPLNKSLSTASDFSSGKSGKCSR